jgi:hypothetical protein
MTVSFTQWLSESASYVRSEDRPFFAKLFRPLYYVYVGALLSVTKRFPWGTNVFDREWDLLIILDACRVDALEAVADEYEFVTDVESMTSVGSTSFEWMNHTFAAEYTDEVRRTGYVTGNTYTDRVLAQDGYTGSAPMPFGPETYDVVPPAEFGHLEELWKAKFDDDSEWVVGDGDGSRRGPRYATERAIEVGRSEDLDRLVVHYMYPHDPFPLADEAVQHPFDALRGGEASRDEVWEAYLDNLRFVLDEVELLLENVDAETVAITADHGEAFGEYGFYRHVIGCPIPCMRQVPWVETEATDAGEYAPDAPIPVVETDVESAEKRLAELGYLD